MSWITRRELARLERELSSALRRAEGAEKALAEERQRHDWLILQLTNRVVTKHGGYALDEVKPEPVIPTQHPRGFIHDPTPEDLDVLEQFKYWAAEAGKDESDAIQKWEAHMRGEAIPIEYDSEQ